MLVELNFDSPVLQRALSALDGVTVRLDHVVENSEGQLRAALWFEEAEETALEDALSSDPTASSFAHLATDEEWLLYRVVYATDVPDCTAYHAAVDNDGATLRASSAGDGWHLQMRFPDRGSFRRFRDRCEAAGAGVVPTAVYDERYEPPSPATPLSDPQRTALATAFDVGYFAVPRDGTLGEVADRLGVSSQAASERIRRGLATLVGESVDESAAAD